MSDYYALLSSLVNVLNGPLMDLSDRVGIPIVSALLLGLLGALSPCQLTTNVAALAHISRSSRQPTIAWRSALAYVLGKAFAYTLVGLLVILIGFGLQQEAVPIIVFVRKALGPALVLSGFYLIGLVRFRFVLGQEVSDWLARRGQGVGSRNGFILGVAFAFAFCPTLFLLFFSVLLPLSIQSRGGILFPSVFALGTTIPLLLLLAIFGLGLKSVQAKLVSTRKLEIFLQRAAGVVFVIVGVNDVLLYWLT